MYISVYVYTVVYVCVYVRVSGGRDDVNENLAASISHCQYLLQMYMYQCVCMYCTCMYVSVYVYIRVYVCESVSGKVIFEDFAGSSSHCLNHSTMYVCHYLHASTHTCKYMGTGWRRLIGSPTNIGHFCGK